jgi:hypothetical protein
MAEMYACTGLSPSALAICGLPPDRSTGFDASEVDFRVGGILWRLTFKSSGAPR